MSAEVTHHNSCVVVTFDNELKQWELGKRAALLVVDLMAAHARPLAVAKHG